MIHILAYFSGLLAIFFVIAVACYLRQAYRNWFVFKHVDPVSRMKAHYKTSFVTDLVCAFVLFLVAAALAGMTLILTMIVRVSI